MQIVLNFSEAKCVREIVVGILAVGGPEKPIQVDYRCADGRHGEVGAIATRDDEEHQGDEEVTMIVNADAGVNPEQSSLSIVKSDVILNT